MTHNHQVNNFSCHLSFQEDKMGKKDQGPKSWGAGSGGEDGGWKSYILPIILALLASIIYRIYFS